MENPTIDERLERIESDLSEVKRNTVFRKNTLNTYETAAFLNVSLSNLYKLTHQGKIPHYKPNNKRIYFDRSELEKWIRSNRIASEEEIDAAGDTYLANKRIAGNSN